MILGAINGFVWGWVVALMSLGLSLVYGVLGVINIAHGAFYMLGAVVGWYIQAHNFWLAVLFAPLVVGILGAFAERTVLRPLEGKGVMSVIATFGLMLLFEHGVLLTFGGAPRWVETPAPFLFSLNIAGLPYPAYRAFVALTSILCVIGLWLFLFRLKFGRWIRATQQNRELALSLGIPVPFVYGLTFGMGAWLAALAGVLTSPIVAVDYRMGLEMLIVSFVVVIVGGLGSLKGAVLVAIIFSTLEGILAIKTEPTAARIIVLLVMGAVLLIRPQGLFGRER